MSAIVAFLESAFLSAASLTCAGRRAFRAAASMAMNLEEADRARPGAQRDRLEIRPRRGFAHAATRARRLRARDVEECGGGWGRRARPDRLSSRGRKWLPTSTPRR